MSVCYTHAAALPSARTTAPSHKHIIDLLCDALSLNRAQSAIVVEKLKHTNARESKGLQLGFDIVPLSTHRRRKAARPR